MCLDVWNKVVKISYDEKVLKSKNMLYNVDEVEDDKLYCGFLKSVSNNGAII